MELQELNKQVEILITEEAQRHFTIALKEAKTVGDLYKYKRTLAKQHERYDFTSGVNAAISRECTSLIHNFVSEIKI